MQVITKSPVRRSNRANQPATAASGSALNDRIQFAFENSLLTLRATKDVQEPDGVSCGRNAEGIRDQQEDHSRLEKIDHLLAKHGCLHLSTTAVRNPDLAQGRSGFAQLR